MDLQLYRWSGKDVFPRYSSGQAFALARSVDEARALIRAEYLREHDWVAIAWELDDDEHEKLRQEQGVFGFLDRDPEVINYACAFCIEGSE